MPGCDGIRDRLIDFIEGELPAEDRRPVEAHLRRCPQCSREVVGLREALARVRALPEPVAPAHLLDGFAAAVQGRLAAERPPRLPFWRKATARLDGFVRARPIPAFSAAAVLGILLVIGLVRTSGRPQVSPAPEVLVVGESLSMAQNLDVLEQFDLLEDLDLLEQFPFLRGPGNNRPLTLG
jgi:anti-sigma factor RsiW